MKDTKEGLVREEREFSPTTRKKIKEDTNIPIKSKKKKTEEQGNTKTQK
jgi:hypothetical protein